MEIIRSRISRQDLIDKYLTHYDTVVKVVVDLSRRIMAVDAEWHADLELLLLDDGSHQEDLWGLNLLPHEAYENFFAYESLINIRPKARNFSIEIADPVLRARIKEVVDLLVAGGPSQNKIEEPSGTAYPPSAASPSEAAPEISYPCFKHHKQLTMEKWRSFEPYKRVLMIANEFGRAKAFLAGSQNGLFDCYERALELFHITIEAGRIEQISPDIIAGLLRLRERTAKLLVERRLDSDENIYIREELIRLDPDGYRLFQPENFAQST